MNTASPPKFQRKRTANLKVYLYAIRDTIKTATITYDSSQLKQTNIFFVFALGRSGTQFLSRTLNQHPSTRVLHEPTKRDTIEYARSFSKDYNFNKYANGYRKKYLQNHLHKHPVDHYGEVNSILRRHAAALLKAIPNSKGLYMIRDGRDVVRSMMSRALFTDEWFHQTIHPSENDPYLEDWQQWGAFEKCCWLWASENVLLKHALGKAFRLEQLLNDYDYFKDHILSPTGLDISQPVWESQREVKSMNHTRAYTAPHYSEWSKEWQTTFWDICGEVMQENGYEP